MISHKTYDLFPTAVVGYDLAKHVSKELTEYIRNTKTAGHVLVQGGVSNYGGVSQNLAKDEFLKPLFEDMQKAVNHYCQGVGLEESIITDSWFNILGKGGFVTPHRHEGSVVSGAFYPYAEDNSCSLMFETPLRPVRMNDIYAKETPFSATEVEFPCQTGLLLIFPSWLIHRTKKNKSEERITISFNTMRTAIKRSIEQDLLCSNIKK